ncbi:FmdE family protein [Pyrococcus sp. ST04]|uniref:FmdE family protein n=1 Tax=Pyrococcus sp. ST04 TaxID=1183377 RepID=UPI0002605CE5|nr:FmdE family protein [Pyrococcus sp. ST04]AFK22423.1 formylmethanofuran dehydrogenase subunit E [Pyrococcus sp. ST04]
MLKINELVAKKDLEGILEYAREFHGHICPYLALGIKASIIAMEELNVERLDYSGSVDESILAIVETNSCFADGVQVTTGCTLGNNSLIYIDTGKTALTLVKRGNWEGIRVYVDADRLKKFLPDRATELFNKVVKERKGTYEERKELWKLWEEIGRKFLYLPEDVFEIKRIKVVPIEQAPIFESIRCSKCNELVMSSKVIYINEKPYCKICAGEEILAVVGRGITKVRRVFE